MPFATFRTAHSLSSRWIVPRSLIGSVLACAVLLTGCSGSSRTPVELHEARGHVEFNGKPPVGAQITLHPKDSDWPLESLPSASVEEDGGFRLGTLTRDDGAPAGTYIATLQWFRVERDGTVGGNSLPAKYASPSSSPLNVSVVPGEPVLPPLRLTR